MILDTTTLNHLMNEKLFEAMKIILETLLSSRSPCRHLLHQPQEVQVLLVPSQLEDLQLRKKGKTANFRFKNMYVKVPKNPRKREIPDPGSLLLQK